MTEMQRARLIPISGIGSAQEAETRATSALLAVLTVVRDFSDHLFSPLGASSAKKAEVEAFTEVRFPSNGKTIRPDGLIRVTYGSRRPWEALVEVKTGQNTLDADQINAYWDIARENDMNAVVTISNEIAATPGIHPTDGLRVRSNSPVQVHHLSWTAILSAAVMVKMHKGIEDPEQSWILGELIRYLENPQSGAMAFDDMGADWVSVRNSVRESTLTPRTAGVDDVVARFDQLLRFAALRLGAEVGADVTQVLAKAERDPKVRSQHLIDSLCTDGVLEGVLRVPNTAGDLEIVADVKAQRLAASVTIHAPEDRGAVARVTWLLSQLRDAHPGVVIESWAKNARTPTASATLREVMEDKATVLDDKKTEPMRFKVITRNDMGIGRGTGGKNQTFIDSVLGIIQSHYAGVVQNVTPWQPKAPRVPGRKSDADDATRPLEPDSESSPAIPMPPANWSESQ